MHIIKTDASAAKNKKSFFLCSAFELGFVNFLQRYFFKEHLVFGARTCIRYAWLTSNLTPGDQVCIKLEETDQALAYAVLLNNGLGGVIIADKEYPGKVCIKIINEMLQGFQGSYAVEKFAALQKDADVDYPPLEKMIKCYQDPKQADKLLQLEASLTETQTVLTKTMSDVGSAEPADRPGDEAGRADGEERRHIEGEHGLLQEGQGDEHQVLQPVLECRGN